MRKSLDTQTDEVTKKFPCLNDLDSGSEAMNLAESRFLEKERVRRGNNVMSCAMIEQEGVILAKTVDSLFGLQASSESRKQIQRPEAFLMARFLDFAIMPELEI